MATKTKQTQAGRIAEYQIEAQEALRHNVCPLCGKGVRQNLALNGWVQCEQFGADGFRKDDNQPSCEWQGFTV